MKDRSKNDLNNKENSYQLPNLDNVEKKNQKVKKLVKRKRPRYKRGTWLL